MRFLGTMTVGSHFRPAHPEQVSLNNRPMPNTADYRIIKVFAQSPGTVISVASSAPGDGFFSLHPRTPVVLRGEPLPSGPEVFGFLGGSVRKKVVRYKLTWDGSWNIDHVCKPEGVAVVRALYAAGLRDFTPAEARMAMRRHYATFRMRQVRADPYDHHFRKWRRHLVSLGLLEEIVADAVVSSSVVDANLQEN
jgi:hypothetical protein